MISAFGFKVTVLAEEGGVAVPADGLLEANEQAERRKRSVQTPTICLK
jgi:hypothetical protein